jgi:glycerol-3-phosphate dehydrogenase
MKRDLAQLSRNVYDLLIIGGGIYGAWTAWDAAQRGLSVALVDKDDFGSATSSNTMKIIHGGLRYLQHADFRRMRQSIHERMVLMRVAPHLVHPLPFLMPTYGHFMQGKEVMSLALLINDIIGFDRNQLGDPAKYLPRGRLISKDECLRIYPGLNEKGLTGGAIWYDCQMYNSERLLLSILRSAEKAGANPANHLEVIGFIKYGNRVTGVKARDVITEEELDIHAKVIVNTSGPWVDYVLSFLNGYNKSHRVFLSKAMNVVVKRQLIPKYAVCVSSKSEYNDDDSIISKGSRLFFITPWRDSTLIGTTYIPYDGDPDGFKVTEEDIESFIHEVNQAYPAASLRREDISFFHGGLLPIDGNSGSSIRLTKKYRILDHIEDGIEGLISVVGVKYTTARAVAEETIDLVFRKLGRKPSRCLTGITPVHGGNMERFNDLLTKETEKKVCGLDTQVIGHLVYNYGSEYHEVLKYLDENPDLGKTVNDTSQIIKAEVLYGVREEMAQKLADMILRRTEFGSAGNPGDRALKNCALIMARELGWNDARIQREMDETKAVFPMAV